MSRSYNRFSESLGNILHMEHVNLMIPDQAPAILFYVTGLGFTRDPFLMTGLDNMWINIGRSQIHLPRRDPSPQILRGRIGLVSPNLKATFQSLKMIKNLCRKQNFHFHVRGSLLTLVVHGGIKFAFMHQMRHLEMLK